MRKLGWHERRAILVNQNNETILTVIINIYQPDCFKWDKLHKNRWTVFVV